MTRLGHHRSSILRGSWKPSLGRGRLRSEVGASVIELALVALLLFVLVAGTFDYGMAWRSGLGVNEAVRTGARVGSSVGSDREADYASLSGLKASLSSSGLLDGLERVVVFRATSSSGQVPDSCKTGTSSSCQVIDGDSFRSSWESQNVFTATNSKGCLNVASSKNWCPTDREGEQNDADYYGVWIKVSHDYLFPIIGDQVDIERTAVMRIEPEVE